MAEGLGKVSATGSEAGIDAWTVRQEGPPCQTHDHDLVPLIDTDLTAGKLVSSRPQPGFAISSRCSECQQWGRFCAYSG